MRCPGPGPRAGLAAALSVVAAVSCGPPPAPPERPPTPDGSPPVRTSWAESPLAPLARDLLATARAAMAGEPIEAERIHVREGTGPRVEDGVADVAEDPISIDDASGRPQGRIAPIALLTRLEARVDDRWLVLAWWLDDEQARVIQLERRDAPASTVAAPDDLAGAAREALGALGEGRLSVQRPETAPSLPPRPSGEQLEALRRLAAEGTVEEVRVDDVALLARDTGGTRWLLELSIVEVTADRIVLGGDPLLTVVPVPE